MFSRKYYNRYLDDHFDRQYYRAKLKLKKFDTEEFQSINIQQHRFIPSHHQSEKIDLCVQTQNLSFHYNSHNPILKNISINVPQGKIYALLGSSGCGKTTLLRMILGTLKPLTGSIRVFGLQPGTSESNIPGSGVGYMPQDLALFRLLTIAETFKYYGHLYGISKAEIKKRTKHYIDFLNLPNKNRLITQLSGGQQRRVSLAVTLLHQPPLLILDEPTVGVDSLLRLKIWNYLEELCTKGGTTVIITTHYTEEARNSFKIGFVDSGVILAEDNPQTLLFKYNCRSLEDVFLELCLERARLLNATMSSPSKDDVINDNNNANNNDRNCIKTKIIIEEVENEEWKNSDQTIQSKPKNEKQPSDINNNQDPKVLNLNQVSMVQEGTQLELEQMTVIDGNKYSGNYSHGKFARNHYFNYHRLRTLLTKNYILYKRNPVSIILMYVIPLLQITLFCVTFARNPRNIPIAVVNKENKSTSLSNLFIDQLDRKILHLEYFKSLDDAIQSVHESKTRNVLMFPENFSRYFRKRFLRPEQITEKIVNNSKIEIYPDTTNAIFFLYTYQTVLNAFEKFIKIVGEIMGYNPSFFGSPVEVVEIVHGKSETQYFKFITPGMIISVVHGLSMLIGSLTVIRERFDGHLERGFVAGIKTTEILLSHIFFYLLPLFTQVFLVLFLTFYIFESESSGSLWGVFLISFMSAYQGLIFGIAISVICPSQVASLMLVFCIEMPLIFTSGLLWPLESIPSVAQTIIVFNPLSLPIKSIQYIMFRGWKLFRFEVVLGLISSISYTSFALIFSFVFFEIFR